MSQSAFGIPPFSTDVDLWLECEGGPIPLSQVGSTFIMAVSPQVLPACNAVIVVSVDGKSFSRPVRLVNGMSAANPKTMVLENDSLPF